MDFLCVCVCGCGRLGSTDFLDSPSSRIVLGKPVLGGTGSFDILADLSHPASTSSTT